MSFSKCSSEKAARCLPSPVQNHFSFHFWGLAILKKSNTETRVSLDSYIYIINDDTVELQWLEHLWDHENMFQTGIVRAI